jgi:hypothetical protein
VRRIHVVVTFAAVGILLSAIGTQQVRAAYGRGASTVGCNGGVAQTSFGGVCVGLAAPTAPTRPALWHPWTTVPPTVPQACTPYSTTEWAAASGESSEWSGGAVWTVDGQRIPIVYSTPQTDWGWLYKVSCAALDAVRFVRVVGEPRSPSPCSLQTAPADCLPGLDPSGFLADVAGQVPEEKIGATPAGPGVVGVPVQAQLSPTPEAKYAEIDLAVPDVGDGDPGETLHVAWVVEATPELVSWAWPDGSGSSSGRWIPQTYVANGGIHASLVYSVRAAGFWSDGVTVHELPSVSVGTIPIAAQLAYSVEQIQPALG